MAEILVIEDNPENLQLMTYLLRAFGHTCREAVSGEAGLRAAAEKLPDLVLCDIQLPQGMDGFEVCRRLKRSAATSPVPVIAVTALAMVGDRDRVLAGGFDGYVAKPLDPQNFIAQVKVFLTGEGHFPMTDSEPILHPSPVAAWKGATILVVDNSPLNLELMRSILEPNGYRLVTASSVREGLALARRNSPDLIVSDVHMPEQTGFEFIEEVKRDPGLRALPFVFISSTVFQDRDRRRGLSLGAVRFLERPIGPRELMAEIEAVLAERPQGGQGRG